MKVLSLFDGMSCGQLALDRIGIKPEKYYASEIDKYPIQITQKNYPDTIQLGNVENWREWDIPWEEIDLLIGGSPCFCKGTKIITNNGYKNIEDIIVGDYVLTHTNTFKKVLNIGSKISITTLLKAQGIKDTTTTDNHPYYVREMRRKYNSTKRTHERVFSVPLWKKVEDIGKGDFIGIPILNTSANPFNLTEEKCWLIGRYIADGHIRHYKRKNRINSYQYGVIYSIGDSKLGHFKENVTAHFSCYRHTKSVHRCVFSDMNFVKLLHALGVGEGAINKKISMSLLNLPVVLLEKVLDGYMSGDGSAKEGVFRANSISEELIMSLNLAIAKVYRTNSAFYYTVTPDTCVIEGRTVNQHNVYSTNFRKSIKKQSNAFVEGDIIWCPVKGVSHTGLFEMVYNMEVEGDNSYTANNAIVHNCQGFSYCGKQLNFDDPRSKLFFHYADILNKIKPKYFLLENVNMKQESKQVISDYLGVEPVEINSALVSGQVRKRLYWTNIPFDRNIENKNILISDILEDQGIPVIKTHGMYDIRPEKSMCIDANYWKGPDNHGQRTIILSCEELGKARLNGHDFLKRVYSIWGKCPTLTAVCGGNQERKIAVDNQRWRKLTPIECERLQTVPDNYTSGVSNTRRYAALGNGWTIDVIAHILSFMEEK